jgi:hypothetical protein
MKCEIRRSEGKLELFVASESEMERTLLELLEDSWRNNPAKIVGSYADGHTRQLGLFIRPERSPASWCGDLGVVELVKPEIGSPIMDTTKEGKF